MTWNPPAGYTERADLGSFGGVGVATKQLASGAATGTLQFTNDDGELWEYFGFTVAITEGAVDQTVSPTGIASAEAFGSPQINLTVEPTGIPSGEAFGNVVATTPDPQFLSPAGIVSGEAFGDTTMVLYISPTGIPTGEALGSPRLAALISPTGIPTGEAFGAVVVGVEQFPAPTGIASEEAFGSPTLQLGYPQTVEPVGIVSLERMTQQPTVLLRHRLTLRPPSIQETPAGQNILHVRYGVHRGISIIRRQDGSIYSTRYPALTDLEAASQYWMGGYVHALTVEESEELTAAGFGSYITLEEVE